MLSGHPPTDQWQKKIMGVDTSTTRRPRTRRIIKLQPLSTTLPFVHEGIRHVEYVEDFVVYRVRGTSRMTRPDTREARRALRPDDTLRLFASITYTPATRPRQPVHHVSKFRIDFIGECQGKAGVGHVQLFSVFNRSANFYLKPFAGAFP